MSKIKSLILGSAAIIAASVGAQAADLPVKAKAVQYVKICSLYGAGFYYIPGTDTCIKLGGYVQLDVTLNGGIHGKPAWDETALSTKGSGSRDSNYFNTRARSQLNIDTRTATEYGVVRTFTVANFDNNTGFGPSAGAIAVDYAFVQFAGFTFGKAVSSFSTPWGAYGANNNTAFLLGGADSATGITQVAYTWQFGNGLSAQLGVEDGTVIPRAQLINTSQAATAATIFTGVYTNSYGGNVAPDITGNLRMDSAAFTAQLSAAAHNVHATYYGANETTGHPSDVWGFAVSGGLQLKNLPTGPGDKISLDATYADGAMKYLIGGVTGNNFDKFGSPVSAAGYASFASLALADGVFTGTNNTNGTSISKTTGWGFRGAYVHNWSPTWESSVFGSFTAINYGGTATAALCANKLAVAATVGVFGGGFNAATCNPDFNIWQVGTRTAWTPVRNLTFSAEGMYTLLDQKDVGNFTTAAAVNPVGLKPPGTYEFKDQGIWSGSLRVRRTW